MIRADKPGDTGWAVDAGARRKLEAEIAGWRGERRGLCAVPDPHIERWLLVDSAAFKTVFGRGCDAPDQKCERARYKKMLIDTIRASGVIPSLGGIEFSEDIVLAMDISRASGADASLTRLVEELRAVLKEWLA